MLGKEISVQRTSLKSWLVNGRVLGLCQALDALHKQEGGDIMARRSCLERMSLNEIKLLALTKSQGHKANA